MKTKLKLLFGLMVASFISTSALASEKIGVVDMRAILAASPQAKVAMEKLKNEFKPREDKIVAADKTLKEKTEKLSRNAAVMGEAEKAKLEREVMAGQRDLQRMQTEFREDATLRQQDETKKIMDRVTVAVQEVAQKEKYDLILPSDGLPYASKNVNITDKVIKALTSAS